MLPTAYEFHWDLGHIFFLGIFYGILTTILVTLGVTAFRWLADLRRQNATAIEWEEAFQDLPLERRHCRHEFDGTVTDCICNHGFDCASCPRHPELVAANWNPAATDSAPVGLRLPADRLYHRGHTWVEPGPGGILTVGLDDFAERCFGPLDHAVLPKRGRVLQAGERSVVLKRGSLCARVSAPVAGEVVEQGDPEHGWLYRLRPTGPTPWIENLLRGSEALVWMVRELDWLQQNLNSAGEAPTMTDGGTLVDDLVQAYPDADWDRLWGQVCLDI